MERAGRESRDLRRTPPAGYRAARGFATRSEMRRPPPASADTVWPCQARIRTRVKNVCRNSAARSWTCVTLIVSSMSEMTDTPCSSSRCSRLRIRRGSPGGMITSKRSQRSTDSMRRLGVRPASQSRLDRFRRQMQGVDNVAVSGRGGQFVESLPIADSDRLARLIIDQKGPQPLRRTTRLRCWPAPSPASDATGSRPRPGAASWLSGLKIQPWIGRCQRPATESKWPIVGKKISESSPWISEFRSSRRHARFLRSRQLGRFMASRHQAGVWMNRSFTPNIRVQHIRWRAV